MVPNELEISSANGRNIVFKKFITTSVPNCEGHGDRDLSIGRLLNVRGNNQISTVNKFHVRKYCEIVASTETSVPSQISGYLKLDPAQRDGHGVQ